MDRPVPTAALLKTKTMADGRGLWWWIVIITAALCAPALLIRVWSIAEHGTWYLTSGGEELNLYSLWKLKRNLPLYEDPRVFPFHHTPYNWLFYKSYVWGVGSTTDLGMLLPGRLLTLTSAFLGAWASFVAARALVPETRAGLLAAGSVVAWFNPALVSWWSLTIRPDIPAVALLACGIAALVRGLREGQLALISVGSLAAGAAWGFKQGFFGFFIGALLWLLVKKQWRAAASWTVPFACVVIGSLIIGSELYRYNIINAHSVATFDLRQLLTLGASTLLAGLPVWILTLFVLRRFKESDAWGAVTLGFLAAMAINIVALGKLGSAKNIVFEAYFAGAPLALASLALAPVRALAIAPVGVYAIAQLALFNQIGTLTLEAQEPIADRKRRACIVEALPKPVFSRDPYFAQPWFSTDNRYPAALTTTIWDVPASEKGLLQDGGIEGLISDHYYPALILPEVFLGERDFAAANGYESLEADSSMFVEQGRPIPTGLCK